MAPFFFFPNFQEPCRANHRTLHMVTVGDCLMVERTRRREEVARRRERSATAISGFPRREFTEALSRKHPTEDVATTR